MKEYLRLLRPEQYIKNIFLFLPAFFALRITDGMLLARLLIAFVAFSWLASAVYIFNDFLDREDDRKHPVKQFRPLAAGTISTTAALVLLLSLMTAGLLILFFLEKKAFYFALAYLLLNIAYTLKLKHVPILDLFIIAAGFVLRIFLGASLGEIPVTMWIVLMTFLLALFLGLAKRRDDVLLARLGSKTRKSIDGYNLEFINSGMIIMASVLIVCYISYTISPEVQAKFDNHNLYFTVFFVVLGILRYLQITFVEENSGSPSRVLLRDPFLQLTIIGWMITFVFLIYR